VSNSQFEHGETSFAVKHPATISPSREIRESQLSLESSETPCLELYSRMHPNVATWARWLLDDGHGSGESFQKDSTCL
jgi:hypothetical protein